MPANGRRARALSPILSAVILIMATVAAGIIVYQYFIGTVKNMTSKPMVYVNNAQYIENLNTLFVNVYNSGPSSIRLTNASIVCANGETINVKLNNTEVGVGQSKTLTLQVSSKYCIPRYIIVNYANSVGKVYSTEAVEVVS